MKVTASLPTGVAALLFDSARHRRRLEGEMVESLERADFTEVVLPVVDYLEPYDAMLSETSRAELYRFVDRDGAMLALRADFTPMLARLLAPHLDASRTDDLPLRVFYRGDVLRYQEERAGRQRELYQLGAEILGAEGEKAEAEALLRFLELLAVGERSRLTVVVGFAGALDRLLMDRFDDRAEAIRLVDAIVRRERHPARTAGEGLLQVVQHGVPDDPEVLGTESAAHLRRLGALLEDLQARFPAITLRLDLAEFADQVTTPELVEVIGARAYYDGVVFRAFTDRSAEPVGNGGRYDRLFERLGARITACGFSFSLDRLVGRGRPS
ncbi:MAG: ATP phosphoribosyltransferase regulatory subunit [Thermoanaerobaculia bacterium]|nr:ATP phosphoribosyltransferase regulatory subunit [Thermoanaerobaculia bacterium]